MLTVIALAVLTGNNGVLNADGEWPVSEKVVRKIASLQRGSDSDLLRTTETLNGLGRFDLAWMTYSLVSESYSREQLKAWKKDLNYVRPFMLSDMFSEEAPPLPPLIQKALDSLRESDVEEALVYIRSERAAGRNLDISGRLNVWFKNKEDPEGQLCFLIWDEGAIELACKTALNIPEKSLKNFVSRYSRVYRPPNANPKSDYFEEFLGAAIALYPDLVGSKLLAEYAYFYDSLSLYQLAAKTLLREIALVTTDEAVPSGDQILSNLLEKNDAATARDLALAMLPEVRAKIEAGSWSFSPSFGVFLNRVGLQNEAAKLAKLVEPLYISIPKEERGLDNARAVLVLAMFYIGAGESKRADDLILGFLPGGIGQDTPSDHRRQNDYLFDFYVGSLSQAGRSEHAIEFANSHIVALNDMMVPLEVERAMKKGERDRARALVIMGIAGMRGTDEFDVSPELLRQMLELGLDDLALSVSYQQYGRDPDLLSGSDTWSAGAAFAILGKDRVAMNFFEAAMKDPKEFSPRMLTDGDVLQGGLTNQELVAFADGRLFDLVIERVGEESADQLDGMFYFWAIHMMRENQDDAMMLDRLLEFLNKLMTADQYEGSPFFVAFLLSLTYLDLDGSDPLSTEMQERVLDVVESTTSVNIDLRSHPLK